MKKIILNVNIHITVYVIWLIACITFTFNHKKLPDSTGIFFMVYFLYGEVVKMLAYEVYIGFLKKSFPDIYYKYQFPDFFFYRRRDQAAEDCAAEIVENRAELNEQLVDVSVNFGDSIDFLKITCISVIPIIIVCFIIMANL